MCEEIKVEEVQEKASEKVSKTLKGIVVPILLNVREEPTKESKSIAVLNGGTEVKITKSKSTEDFYKVSVNKIQGFCMKEFIDIIE